MDFMDVINKLEDELSGKTVELSSLDKDRTVLVVIDMVNGFVYDGALSSNRVAAIVQNIVDINKKTSGFKKIFFLDSHDENSKEFNSFPKHCIEGSSEAELIDELKVAEAGDINTLYIKKNSTNGFITDDFQKWLADNLDCVDNYIITGCVTDICVMQFVLSLKAYFNHINKVKRVIVPKNAVETYDGGSHDGHLMNLFALYNMSNIGVEIVENIN
jgi:nicotinamidase-related amidase